MKLINDLVRLIAQTNRNLVLSRESRQPYLRVGVMPLQVEPGILDILFKYEDNDEILIPHCDDTEQIQRSLEGIINEKKPVVESFADNGIKATPEFKKALFIASLGAKEGEKIIYFMPSFGIERISSYLNKYSKDTSSMVINPNLCGEERLYDVISSNKFDLIGFSSLPITLKNDARVIANSTLLSPDSVKIIGGYNIENYDIEQLFKSFSLDIVVFGNGETAVLSIADRLDNLDEVLPCLPNIVYRRNGTIVKNKRESKKPSPTIYWDITSEIPFSKRDLYHGRTYEEANTSLKHDTKEGSPEEQLVKNSLRLKMSDYCKGSCRWCAAPRRHMYFTPVENIIEQIKSVEDYDGMHFEDNDLCCSKKKVLELCGALVKHGYAGVPKIGKSRIDTVDREILEALSKAGFQKFGYGVESFVQEIIDQLGKEITVQQIHDALNQTFDAGITPIMNIILFSPWETEASVLETLDQSIDYIERGAYLNTAVGMNATFGSKIITSDKNLIIYENIFYKGMKTPFVNPIRLRCIKPGIQELLETVLAKREEYKQQLREQGTVSFSSHLNSLCAYRTIYHLLGRDCSRIEAMIEKKVGK